MQQVKHQLHAVLDNVSNHSTPAVRVPGASASPMPTRSRPS